MATATHKHPHDTSPGATHAPTASAASAASTASTASTASAASAADWTAHATAEIEAAGLRKSGARQKVIAMLGKQTCALTALDIDAKLPKVGRATVYRAIEQLEELNLIHRVDLGGNAFGYEKVDPTGDHHHHIVCDQCGKVEPFADEELEKAIHEIRQNGFKISSHEITLKGTCRNCD